jgi:tRNA(Ile)-lysidine synthase TilS/MesJ
MHGTGKIIPYSRNNRIFRPFRLNRKRDLELWASLNNVPYIEDESNVELGYTRNYVRHVMMQNVLKVNPGIHKTIAKKVRADEHSTLATV